MEKNGKGKVLARAAQVLEKMTPTAAAAILRVLGVDELPVEKMSPQAMEAIYRIFGGRAAYDQIEKISPGLGARIFGLVGWQRRNDIDQGDLEMSGNEPYLCLLVPLGATMKQDDKAKPRQGSNDWWRWDDSLIDSPMPASDFSPVYASSEMPILKMDEERHLVYGVVLEPEAEDTQGDMVAPEEIEKAAHHYMEYHRVMKEQHQAENPLISPVESYIAPEDFTLGGQTVKKGSWVIAAHVNDPQTWAAIKAGEYTGFSIGGEGVREPAD